MEIHFTEHAEENLASIHAYHCAYNEDFANSFNDEITDFIISGLTAHPKLGHVYNEAENLYRLIFRQRYSIYYLIRNDTIFILYILDGRLSLNEKLRQADIELR